MTTSRNQFIAETAAKLLADPSRSGIIDTYVKDATDLAKALERADCAPWANYDLIVSHGRQEAIDAAVTKERERCAQAVKAAWVRWENVRDEFNGNDFEELIAAIRTGAAP